MKLRAPSSEPIEGPTPHGGAYMTRVYESEQKEPGTEVIVVEYDENDEMIAETWAKAPLPRRAPNVCTLTVT
jgi:hypothetical protein